MKLSSDIFAAITESVTIVGQDQPMPADRRAPRVKLSSHLFAFKWSDPAQPMGIRVRDISEGGVGIFHHHRFALDEKLVIRFPLKNDQNLLVLGSVIYWEPLAEDLCAIGVQFERVIDQAELDARATQTSRERAGEVGVLARLSLAMARSWAVAS
jgi:hypothetical protein